MIKIALISIVALMSNVAHRSSVCTNAYSVELKHRAAFVSITTLLNIMADKKCTVAIISSVTKMSCIAPMKRVVL